jgi:hypothetical protein
MIFLIAPMLVPGWGEAKQMYISSIATPNRATAANIFPGTLALLFLSSNCRLFTALAVIESIPHFLSLTPRHKTPT